MDINRLHETALLSEDEAATFHNPDVGRVIGLGEIRQALPGILMLAQGRLECAPITEQDKLLAELILVEGMVGDLMVYDMEQYLKGA